MYTYYMHIYIYIYIYHTMQTTYMLLFLRAHNICCCCWFPSRDGLRNSPFGNEPIWQQFVLSWQNWFQEELIWRSMHIHLFKGVVLVLMICFRVRKHMSLSLVQSVPLLVNSNCSESHGPKTGHATPRYVMWPDTMWCDVKWSDVKWHEVTWGDVTRRDATWSGVTWYDAVHHR